MQIVIESTNVITSIDGVPVRLWEGTTSTGITCQVFVHRIAVDVDQDATAFEKTLIETNYPQREPRFE